MFEKDCFLRVNPDIYKMMQNDVSLKNIATIDELRNLNLEYIRTPILYTNMDINFDLNSFDVSNFMKILLCMVVNKRLNYTLHYENCCCYESDVSNLMGVLQKAFEICHSRFIEYFSGISCVELKSNARMHGNIVNSLDIEIILTEHYRGALLDTVKFLKICEYIKSELVRNYKINKNMTEYEIAKVLFNWVVLHTNYDNMFKKYSFTGYSAVAYGYAVCQGFTALYNALCKCFGISIVGMYGKAINKIQKNYENHIWSFALLEGKNTYIDVTWGKPLFQDEKNLKKYDINPSLLCNFEFFDIPYNVLEREHIWDKNIYG